MNNTTMRAGALNGNYIGSAISFKDTNGDVILGKFVGMRRDKDYKSYTIYLEMIGSFDVAWDLDIEVRNRG